MECLWKARAIPGCERAVRDTVWKEHHQEHPPASQEHKDKVHQEGFCSVLGLVQEQILKKEFVFFAGGVE